VEANARNDKEQCFLWSGEHISAAGYQHATIKEAVFCVGAAPRLYNEDFRQLQLQLREPPELAELLRTNDKKIGCSKKTSQFAAVTVRLL
jgi:hypothetical protein